MITILSPAKSLNFKSETQTKKYSTPSFLNHSATLINELKKYSPGNIRELMKISDGLGELNFIRFQNWQKNHSLDNSRQAILAFNGEVYNGLKALSLGVDDLLFAQENVRILSGLYGILKPLDLIQPYRLEMGTRLSVAEHKNLYGFWGNMIINELIAELGKSKFPFIINLASNEYSKAACLSQFGDQVITPVFKEYKNDAYKVITVYAKKARGLMTRFIIENKIGNPEDLKSFESEGYAYSDNLSDKTCWVFTR
jgi:cytoplasmic iron level regulating protein YaaA (DUF328/UPF0246 family)